MLNALLLLIFSPVVDRCGSPQFWVRERAQAVLTAWWPLSAPALRLGLESPDCEIQMRCKRAEPKDWRNYMAAAALVSHEFERDGMPLADLRRVPAPSEGVRLAVVEMAEQNGIPTDDGYWFGHGFWNHPTGYDRVRITLRGCWPADAEWHRGSAAWMPERVRALWQQGK